MNAFWKYTSMYAMAYDAEEQAGLHDGLGILLQMLGEDREPQGEVEHMISLGTRPGRISSAFGNSTVMVEPLHLSGQALPW